MLSSIVPIILKYDIHFRLEVKVGFTEAYWKHV